MQLSMLRQLLSMKLINDFEYEKIKKRLMRDYGVVSNITTCVNFLSDFSVNFLSDFSLKAEAT